jgi:hypothetical protein
MSAADDIKSKLYDMIMSVQPDVIEVGPPAPSPSGMAEDNLRSSLLEFFSAANPPSGVVIPFSDMFSETGDPETGDPADPPEPPPPPALEATNKTNHYIRAAVTGQDGKLYFATNAGIYFLDDDGQIKPTNKTNGQFMCAATGQDGKLYFGTSGGGIWYLDDDGVIKQTNDAGSAIAFAALGQDDKLYFGGHRNGFGGIKYLDDDGTIKNTNITSGFFHSGAMGQDGRLYFAAHWFNNSVYGVWFLDDDGIIKQTTKTDGSFNGVAMGQDNRLYFSSDGEGIFRLDDDGIIRQTNITAGYFSAAGIGQDGKLYFGSSSSNGGIYFLDDDGQIKPTNKTNGSFTAIATGQDGRLYFAGSGVWYLDYDGEIKSTNKTSGSFASAGMGQDGKLYFGTNGQGIFRLNAQAPPPPDPDDPDPDDPDNPDPDDPDPSPAPPSIPVFKYGSKDPDDVIGVDAKDIDTDLFVKSCDPLKGYVLLVFSVEDLFRKCMRYTLMKSKVLDFQTQNQGQHLANLIALTEDEWEFFGEDFLGNAAIAVHNLIGAYGRNVGVRSMVFNLGTVAAPGTIIYTLKVPGTGFFHNYVIQLWENIASALYYSVLQQWATWCNDAGEVQANTAKYTIRSEAIMSFRNIGCPRATRPTRFY